MTTLNPEKHEASLRALEHANARRFEAAEYKRKVSSGALSIEGAIRDCGLPITVTQLLKCAPYWGPHKVGQAIRNAGLPTGDLVFGPGNKRCRTISDEERERLLFAVATGRPQKPDTKLLMREEQKHEIRRRMAAAGCTMDQIRKVVK